MKLRGDTAITYWLCYNCTDITSLVSNVSQLLKVASFRKSTATHLAYSFEDEKACSVGFFNQIMALHWRHNELDSVPNHQPHHCLLSRLFGRRSKKTSKLRVTGLCVEFTGTGEFPAQMASYAENVSIWWLHHGMMPCETWACRCTIYQDWNCSWFIRPSRDTDIEIWISVTCGLLSKVWRTTLVVHVLIYFNFNSVI